MNRLFCLSQTEKQLLLHQRREETEHEPNTKTSRQFLLLVVKSERNPLVGNTGNVEVHERHPVIHEILEKQSGRPRTNVRHTGEVADVRTALAPKHGLEAGIERHGMDAVCRLTRREPHVPHQTKILCFLVGVQGRDRPKRHHLRTGEGGESDDHLRPLVLRKGHRVGQDQPALGIRVADFNRLARHGLVDVAGLVGTRPRHVLRDRHDTVHDRAERQQSAKRLHDANARCGASHVDAHVPYGPWDNLEIKAAGVKRHPLPDDPDVWRRVLTRDNGAVGHVDETRTLLRCILTTLPHCEKESCTHLPQLGSIVNPTGHPLVHEPHCGVAHGARVNIVAAIAHELTGGDDRLCDLDSDLNPLELPAHFQIIDRKWK